MTRQPVSAARTALTGLLVVAAVLVPAGASAAGSAATTGTGTGTVTTAVFGAAPRTATHTGTAPLVLAWTAASLLPQYFDVRNTGALDLAAAGYAVDVTNGGRGNPRVVLTACVGARWSLAGLCPGTQRELGSWAVGSPPAPADVALPVGQDLHVRATTASTNLRPGERLTASISVTVSTGTVRQVRAAATTSG